jgi:hypothetical protein
MVRYSMYYFQKTCMVPTFFDVNGTEMQGIENLSIIIFLDNPKFKSIQPHLNLNELIQLPLKNVTIH